MDSRAMNDWRRWATAEPRDLGNDAEFLEWRAERKRSYEQFRRTLQDQGFAIAETRALDPVVVRGTLPTGEPFILECQADTCRISDWPPGSGLFAEVTRWSAPFAGWIGADEAALVLQELVALARYDACLIADRGLIVERHEEEILRDTSQASARQRSFIRLKRRLVAQGFPRVVVETEQCPIQLLGNLPTGEPFFLWCRSDTCLLNVGADSDVLIHVIDDPLWFGTIQRWRHPQADFLSASEVEAVLYELIDRYRMATSADQPGVNAARDIVLRDLN